MYILSIFLMTFLLKVHIATTWFKFYQYELFSLIERYNGEKHKK